MRKITLFLMSMFLMLGTAMAQDENAFSFTSVYPADGSMQTTVYSIQMSFSKNIAVTFPEGGIDVVNTQTQEVTKITRYEISEWNPQAVTFMFEQKMVSGKDGKEELQDLYIETPGAYSYTIPAGVIKSTDGEEYAGGTFTFTIVGTFPVVDFSPKETPQLEEIVLTFDKEITEVKMPNSGMMFSNYYYTEFFYINDEVVISEDKKSVTLTLETPITTPGSYYLDIYQGIFISGDEFNENYSIQVNVIDPTPSFSTNLENGSTVKELTNLEITFNNVEVVELVEGADQVAIYLPNGGDYEGVATLKDNKITVTFDQQLTEQGEYIFVIPAGMFTMDGVPNEAREIIVELVTVNITPLQIVSVTPEAGSEVNQLERITIKFNQPVTLSFDENWWIISQNITLTCGEEEYTLTYDPGNYSSYVSDELSYLVNAEWVDNAYKSTPITAEGNYTLDLSEIVVNYAAEEYYGEYGLEIIWNAKNFALAGTYTWTVTGGAAVENIKVAEGEQEIYDLLGRRVEKITAAGIYIVNGKKVVIK